VAQTQNCPILYEKAWIYWPKTSACRWKSKSWKPCGKTWVAHRHRPSTKIQSGRGVADPIVAVGCEPRCCTLCTHTTVPFGLNCVILGFFCSKSSRSFPCSVSNSVQSWWCLHGGGSVFMLLCSNKFLWHVLLADVSISTWLILWLMKDKRDEYSLVRFIVDLKCSLFFAAALNSILGTGIHLVVFRVFCIRFL
jgi:hypothetical protein